MNRWLSWLLGGVAFLSMGQALAASSPIRFGGRNAEMIVSTVGEHTLRLEVSGLNEKPARSGPEETPRGVTTSGVLAPFPSTEVRRIRELDGEEEFRVGRLRVTIKAEPLSVLVRREDGKVVQELTFDDGAEGAVGFRTEAPVLGLGEGAQQFDRRGALYPMEPTWGGWNRPVLGSVVPSPFLIGTEGWAIFVHQPDGRFDLRGGKGRFLPRNTPSKDARLDLFVIDVREPADAVAQYYRLTGRPVMPPKWALGYFQSHRTLAGPDEPLQIAQMFREKNLPCDAMIYLGTGYCPNGWNTGHGSLQFNPRAMAHPANDIRALRDLNFRIILHVNHAPRNLFGAGIAEASDAPQHIRNYWARHREVFALGVDGWWPDDGDELPLEARLTRHRCYYEGPLPDRPNVRPWSLHRTGYAGAQRYGGWIWSGDIDGRWQTLAAQVSVGLNHSLSLTPFWGTDTGGFYPTPELTGELYARWFEFSAFCPLFRSHGRTWKLRLPWGWNTGEFGPVEHNEGPAQLELHNSEVEPICRKYLELRYRLLPYNYTLVREACDTGLPLMRALWLHYPNDPEAVKLGDEYLWGRDLLVAPVVGKGAKVRRLYLPAGTWHDWWTGEKVTGPRRLERPVDLATLPLYARAGAVIPLDPLRQFTAQPTTEPTVLRVFPGADGTFTLYDDDGQSLGYQNGSDPKVTWIRFHWDDSARQLTIEPDDQTKGRPAVRTFMVELLGGDTKRKQAEYRGERVAVSF